MNKKIIATLSIITLAVIIFSISSNSALDESIISQTIFVDTVYEPENNLVKITYNDNSKKTNLVTLEILGMEQTFHKEFSQNSFVEIVQINSEPKYGWSTMPVVFSVNHDEFGKPIGSDILKKKKSLPVLHLLNESKGNDNRLINDIFANEQNLESFVKHIIGLMSKYKTEKYCNKILNENFKDSEKIITGLKIKNLNKENLKEINQFLVYRKK